MGLAACSLSSSVEDGPHAPVHGLKKKEKKFISHTGLMGQLTDCTGMAAKAAMALLSTEDGLVMKSDTNFVHPISEVYRTSAFYGGERAKDADADDRANTDIFIQALRTGDIRKVVDRAEAGADLTHRTLRGQDCMMLAASSRSPGTQEVMRFLMDAHIGIENQDRYGWTPLSHSSRNGARESTEFLLEAKAEVDCKDTLGRTPLMLACIEGSELLAGTLIAARADVRQQDLRGWTPLFYAAEQGSQDLVKFLMRKFGSPHQVAFEGSSALMVSCVRGNLSASKQIIRRGCDMDHQDHHGNTALMLALAAGQLELGFWLVDENADVELANLAEETAYDIADAQGFNSLKNKILSIARQREEAKKKAALEAAAQAAIAAREAEELNK
eukprot:TRINITY_DN77896_c0_g1_i1.p1 TRINITY_DN77896_c0_g1~~TRINITY_DN77896_c0_g1_i1.p1  ORF type:complete len:386 (+),score=96.77 TRINITY_DN77896_c0_g1_i1:109-1266(+)